jgi:mono/diheme cytochrome c family protein
MRTKIRTTRKIVSVSLASGLLAVLVLSWTRSQAADKPLTPAELEKQNALANPYPNDLGPLRIDDVVAKYPDNIRDGYKILLVKCAQCHTSARPLNSQFVEPEGKNPPAKEAAVAKLRKDHPEYFTAAVRPAIWNIDAHIWSRYVHRMMSKPGCNISMVDGKKIWEFLVYDGVHRKIGANAAAWKAHREKLLSEFKAKYPKRYQDLVSQGEL